MAKTKTSAGGMLVMFVALIVGAGFLYGLVKRTDSNEASSAALSVIFEPKDRTTSVDIIVSIDGVVSISTKTRTSPWNKLVPLRRGQTITLVATQSVPAKLSCAINGQVQETRAFPGSVTCIHKRA
jgi:hypothetical protein